MRKRSPAAWAVLIALCLCAGAATTVLGGWAGLMWGPQPTQTREIEKTCPREVPAGWPEMPDRVLLSSNVFMRGYVAVARQPWAGSGLATGVEKQSTLQVLDVGWPLRALEWRLWGQNLGATINENGRIGVWEVSSRIPVPGDPGPRRMLPTKPVWAGLLVDSVVWGLWWYVLGMAPFVVRRGLRRRRGAFAGCGYDLRGLVDAERCPECGRAESPPPGGKTVRAILGCEASDQSHL